MIAFLLFCLCWHIFTIMYCVCVVVGCCCCCVVNCINFNVVTPPDFTPTYFFPTDSCKVLREEIIDAQNVSCAFKFFSNKQCLASHFISLEENFSAKRKCFDRLKVKDCISLSCTLLPRRRTLGLNGAEFRVYWPKSTLLRLIVNVFNERSIYITYNIIGLTCYSTKCVILL